MTQAQFTIEEIPFFDPIKIANSGQCFRWKILDASHVELVALGRYLQIAYLGSERFAFSCPRSEFNDLWYNYLDLARDYHQVADCILPDDTYLREALAFGEGISLYIADVEQWFRTSNIQKIYWDKGEFTTLNSRYKFEFTEIDYRPILEEMKNESTSNK